MLLTEPSRQEMPPTGVGGLEVAVAAVDAAVTLLLVPSLLSIVFVMVELILVAEMWVMGFTSLRLDLEERWVRRFEIS